MPERGCDQWARLFALVVVTEIGKNEQLSAGKAKNGEHNGSALREC